MYALLKLILILHVYLFFHGQTFWTKITTVGHDLAPNCLQRLSAGHIARKDLVGIYFCGVQALGLFEKSIIKLASVTSVNVALFQF